jgi:transposase
MRATRAIIERDIKLKILSPERLRYATVDRKRVAKELTAKGLSTSDIAKITSTSQRQIQRDVNATNGAENATNIAPDVEKSGKTTRALLSQSDQNDWRTPRKFLEAAREVMGAIDLDRVGALRGEVIACICCRTWEMSR